MKYAAILLLFLISFSGAAQTPLITAVDFTVTDTYGNSHNLFNYLNSGKYVLLDFFFVSCQASAAAANASYENFGCNAGGVIFLGIDTLDNNNQVQTFKNFFGVNYPCASGSEGGGNAVDSAWGIIGYPCYVLVAPNHSVVIQEINPFTEINCNNAISGYGVTPMVCSTGTGRQYTGKTAQNMLVFPNPASTSLSVIFMSTPDKSYALKITDPLGNIAMIISDLTSSSGTISSPIRVSGLHPGMYFINLYENGQLQCCDKISVLR